MAAANDDPPEGLRMVLATIPQLYEKHRRFGREAVRFSDLIIKLAGDEDERLRTWKVHKLVLCPQSKFFARACEGEFKESNEGVIYLHGDERVAIAAMIEFLYTGDYSHPNVRDPEDLFQRSELYLSIFKTADKYDLPGLAKLASTHWTRDITRTFEAFKHPQFPDIIEELYLNCPDNDVAHDMRAQIVKVCIAHEAELRKDSAFVSFREVLQEVQAFKLDFEQESLAHALESHKAKMEALEAEHKKKMHGVRFCCSSIHCSAVFVVCLPPYNGIYCVRCTCRAQRALDQSS